MKCSAYIATSVDGYIATIDGDVDWLHTSGNMEADMGSEDMGFRSYIDSVDCMIMGRKCMEMISSMDLSPEQWPYGDMHIVVLSNTLKTPPENLHGKVELYSGDIESLILRLENNGFKHAYIDGGSTITSFINLKLINEITITRVPILLGDGIPLFGKTHKSVKLTNTQVSVFPNDFSQVKYSVNYV
jgi:dihydrofolate reductase